MHACVYLCMHICTHVCVCVCACVHACVCACVLACVHGCDEIQDYFIISSEKSKCGWTSRYTITHNVYFKTQRKVIENTSYVINKLVIYIIYTRTMF